MKLRSGKVYENQYDYFQIWNHSNMNIVKNLRNEDDIHITLYGKNSSTNKLVFFVCLETMMNVSFNKEYSEKVRMHHLKTWIRYLSHYMDYFKDNRIFTEAITLMMVKIKNSNIRKDKELLVMICSLKKAMK